MTAEHWRGLVVIAAVILALLAIMVGGSGPTPEQRIINLILWGPADGLSAAQLDLRLPMFRMWSLYGRLAEMERTGILVSEWVPGPYPRTRLYRLGPKHKEVEP